MMFFQIYTILSWIMKKSNGVFLLILPLKILKLRKYSLVKSNGKTGG